MKIRINITIEGSLLAPIKEFASSRDTSVSQMVEDYFKSLITATTKKKSILDLVNELEPPRSPDENEDLKKSYYKDRSEKYGF